MRLQRIVHNALASVPQFPFIHILRQKFIFTLNLSTIGDTSTLNKHHFIELFSPITLNANSIIERYCHSVERIFSTHQPIIKKGAASVFAHHQRQEDGNLIYAMCTMSNTFTPRPMFHRIILSYAANLLMSLRRTQAR